MHGLYQRERHAGAGRGIVVPLRYTVNEHPSYSIVPSNALWKDEGRATDANLLRQDERAEVYRCLYFSGAARCSPHSGVLPEISPYSAESMDRLGVSLAHFESQCQNFYDHREVERVFYPEMEQLLLDYFPGATEALVYNHDVFDKHYPGTGLKIRMTKTLASMPICQSRP